MFCCGASQNPNKGEDRSLVSGSMGKGAMLTSKAGQKVGFFSYHGWEKQGWAKTTVKPKINQDRIFITPKLCDSGTSWLFCVYDGNGPKGEKVAQEAGAEIVAAVEGSAAKVTDSSTDVPKVLKDAFVESNKKVCKLSSAEKSGCTATVILVQDLTTLFVANVGDSKAILGKAEGSTWKAKVLTEEHKPNAAAEKARIEAAGGFVLEDEEYGAARVFDTPDPVGQMVAMASAGMSGGMGGDGMVSSMEPWPGLAMSRCLGHTGVDKIGITAEPTVSTHKIFNDDQVLLVASDGVWDYVEADEACAFAKQFAPDAHAACKAIVETASQRWIEDDPTYRDDISCIVVYLPLDASMSSSISHETVAYTEDSATALSNAKAVEITDIAPQTGTVATGDSPAGDKSEVEKKKAMIKASKEQKKRSVVTRFG